MKHEWINANVRRHGLPKRSVNRSVPTDEGAGREEQQPEDGEAEVDPAVRVHTEPGHAAHHVGQQRPSVNWRTNTEYMKYVDGGNTDA